MHSKTEKAIVRYLSGNMSKRDCKTFEAELAFSPPMRLIFEEYKTIWAQTRQFGHSQKATEASWQLFQEKTAKISRNRLTMIQVAASFAVLAIVSVSVWFFGFTANSTIAKNAITQQSLADKTVILLNKNSTLVPLNGYGEIHRKVMLTGQAFFDVAEDKTAFRVVTNVGDVVVYGTKFDVYTDEEITTVELYEGSVHFEHNSKEIGLLPGERLVVQGTEVTKSSFAQKTVWSESISCTDVPLAYILGQLKLNYAVDYTIKNRCLKELYTVSLPKDNLALCLQILSDVVGKNFALIDGQIVLD